MTPTAINQLWVADITYIRLLSEFVYLALVLDSFSREVVGWKLDRTLASRLATGALESAIAARKPRHPVRLRGVRNDPAKARNGPEHEPAGEPVR